MLLPDRSWARPGPTAAQARLDLAGGVVVALVSVASAQLWHSAFGTPLGAGGVEAYLLFGAAGLVLALRRRLPLTVLLVESALFIAVGERLDELGATFTIQMVMFASLYAAWAWSARPRSLLLATGVVLVAMFGWLVWALTRPDVLPTGSYGLLDAGVALFVYQVVVNVVYFGGAIAWGQAAWSSARRRARLDRQQELEREVQRREREQVVRDERVRIARDLHDVVAHHVSSLGVQAAGARRVLERDPEAARAALATIEQSSRDAVASMHQLVGLLRQEHPEGHDPDGRTPQPGLADLPALTRDDPLVEHREVGAPFAVPETVGLSLYRVVQEAVTNVRRHARARSASVTLRYLERTSGTDGTDGTGDGTADSPGHDRAVEVEVIDDGNGGTDRTGPATPGGYGLRGIRERAAMHGGEAEIGPRPDGGFRVRVRVPVGGAVTQP